jgi:hypothetical protein
MEVPDHIYVAGVERKPVQKEVHYQMVVPSRITVEGGEKTSASKAQPKEVIRDRQTILSPVSVCFIFWDILYIILGQ